MLRVATAAALTALAACLMSAAPGAQDAPSDRAEFVELDAVVVDRGGRTVRGLHQSDFQVVEDGQPVPISSFREVSVAGITGRSDARSVVLLLGGTDRLTQLAARQFVAQARPADRIAVVRMNHRNDEVAGDKAEALRRIDEPERIGLVQGRNIFEDWLEAVARISRAVEEQGARHTVLVCMSSRLLCDLYIAPPKTQDLLWPHWTKAVGAAARAHLSVYYVAAAGTRALVPPPLGDGLVEHTGGDTFYNSNNFALAVARAWDEAGHYYLLGYTPRTGRTRELHKITVKTTRRGLQVRVRRSRGDAPEGTGESPSP